MAFLKKNTLFIAIVGAGLFFWFPLVLFATTRTCEIGYTTCDFYAYFIAGKAYLLGLNPYFTPPQILLGEYKIDPEVIKSWYIYPPHFIPFWSYFSLFPYQTAQILWGMWNGLLGIITVWYSLKVLKQAQQKIWVISFSLMVFFSAPLLAEIRSGNTNFFVGCLMMLGFLALLREKKMLAGLLLSLAMVLKVYPLIAIIVIIIIRRDLLFSGIVFLWTGFLTICSFLFMPFSWHLFYVTDILPEIAGGKTQFFANQSIIELVGSVGSGREMLVLIITAACIGISLIFVKKETKVEGRDSLIIAILPLLIGSSSALLLSGLVWTQTFVILLFPLSILFVELIEKKKNMILPLIIGLLLTQAPMFNYFLLNKLNGIGNIVLLTWAIYVLLHPKILRKVGS